MSKLDINYNWNGEYILLKELEERRFKISDLKYPEFLHIFINEDNTLRYSIMDEYFGMPSLANTHDSKHSKELRSRVIKILDDLCSDGYIKKIV